MKKVVGGKESSRRGQGLGILKLLSRFASFVLN